MQRSESRGGIHPGPCHPVTPLFTPSQPITLTDNNKGGMTLISHFVVAQPICGTCSKSEAAAGQAASGTSPHTPHTFYTILPLVVYL